MQQCNNLRLILSGFVKLVYPITTKDMLRVETFINGLQDIEIQKDLRLSHCSKIEDALQFEVAKQETNMHLCQEQTQQSNLV